jgi:cytochrome c biogenesis protein CcdA/thiol-disulfide isomerase/thioredoxin
MENMTKKYPDVDIRMLEVWYNQTNQQIDAEVNAEAGISTPPGVPEIVIGKTVLIGQQDIPDKLEGYLQAIEKKKVASPNLTPSNLPLLPAPSNLTVTGYFFYGEGCSHCDAVKPFIAEIQSLYPNFDLEQLEVYHNATNQALFLAMDQNLGITSPGVPTIIIGNHALVGEDQIRDQLEQVILQEQASPASEANGSVNVTAAKNCPGTFTTLTIPLVIFCAGIDSINPCAFTVLIILLLSIIALQSRRQVLMVGITYIAAVFLFYFISGIGVLSFVHVSGVSSLIALAAAIIAIVLGLVNIIEAAVKKEGFILAIPESKKPVIERYIMTATLPAAFVLGVLVGIFELPCTGGIYLTILSLMSSTLTLSEGIPYLLLYNFIFILPLILILLAVVVGIPPERVNAWRLENRRKLRFAIGVAMILVGVFIIIGPLIM